VCVCARHSGNRKATLKVVLNTTNISGNHKLLTGCYLFSISNSHTLFNRGATVTHFSTLTFTFQSANYNHSRKPPVTSHSDLWPRPLNLTQIASRRTITTTTTTILRPFFQDHPGKPVPEENFWTLWCKGRLTEAETHRPSGWAPLHRD